jgi:catechol 2,3-dioxygenase-like lactoylglutathione lyase family enzyme
MGPETVRGLAGDARAPAAGGSGRAAPAAVTREARLASAVMFVHDLDASVSFYRELLSMEVTVRSTSAALLASAAGFQLYLRSMGPDAQHALGGVGVQYVIWTAPDQEDLRRCERLLKDRGVHVRTQTADDFTLVEGRDPSGLPVVVTYPGPDQAVRHEIMSRIYAW